MRGKAWGEGVELQGLPGCHCTPSPCVHQPQRSPNPIILGVLWEFLYTAVTGWQLIKTPAPLAFQEVRGETDISKPPIVAGSPSNQPPFLMLALQRLGHSRKLRCGWKGFLRNNRAFLFPS